MKAVLDPTDRRTVTTVGLADELRACLPRVFHFCRRMLLDVDEAAAATLAAYALATASGKPADGRTTDAWILRQAAKVLAERISPQPEVSFELLDETLRSEATRTEEVASLERPEREFLLWELKQGCMTAVLHCLPPSERISFVLAAVLGLSEDAGAAVLGIKPSAFRVRLSRARTKVVEYLAPRCEHVDPRNPCHCPSRIGVALHRGFITPPSGEVRLRASRPFLEEGEHDAVAIFGKLPDPEVPASLAVAVDEGLRSGRWG